jgi:cytosine/adenosine deaminase-related metal-dependent hydrolase
MFEESRAAYFRLREDDAGTGSDWPLRRLADGGRLGGAIFGEQALGRVEPGAPADLVVLDYAPPTPLDSRSFAGHWVFGLASRCVRDVMVAGEWVVLDRRLTRADHREIAARAHEQAKRLWARLDRIPQHEFEPRGGLRWQSPLRTE